ncbi:MAG: PQQ-binding-like beta-propeller repeat protein [Pirellulales bacterium]|jgi:outer membrane protein assembly factor BamB|nr:PQQ-binding-like beta-propeller repeat protein [Thermoguttaceae bacterium]MDD4787838.1 PQQ-binding-like beta-propeller repeat protein [Pirellulales bacterium]MDI9444585.1 PQQ-binding-like beta-propeller repeat protein [Planctomycetota bacterium]NLY98960.1 PQQ-binding-like beta-propeller repeat protein [Pirellulaceae bacterium]
MRKRTVPQIVAVLALAVAGGADWRQFRGTDNASCSHQAGLPTEFSAEKNVAWKADLPGRGAASPIVVGDRVFVTASSGAEQDRLHLLAFCAADGSRLWHRQLWATGHTEYSPFGAVAVNTPASDGRCVVAFFSSNDIACFDLDGNLKWFRGLAHDCPTTRNDVGMASSPLIVGQVVVVQCQNQGESFAAGLDLRTGLTRWRIGRQRDAIWSSPTVLRGPPPSGDLVLLHARDALTGHDPLSGEVVFRYEARCHTIASVTTRGNRIYLPAEGLCALQYDPVSRGIEPLWFQRSLRGNNSSPVACGDYVYQVRSPAILSCAAAVDGRKLWDVRLEGAVWATPVVAGGQVYVANHEGQVFVVRTGKKGELLSRCQADRGMLASPAVAGKALYLRSHGQLWKIAAN